MFERWVWVSSFLQKLVWRSFFFALPLYILPPIQPGPLFQTTSEEKIAKAMRGEVETGDGFTGKERRRRKRRDLNWGSRSVRPPLYLSSHELIIFARPIISSNPFWGKLHFFP